MDLAPLASPDLAALGAAGHVIGSRTMTHAALPSLPAEDVRRELQESRLRILHALGTVAQHLAPPYGKVSVRMAELAKECGYLTICSTARGVIGPRELESGVLRRVALRRDRPRLGRFWSVRPAAGSRT